MAKDTNANFQKGTIDLEDMEVQFGDDDSLASAINAALEDADAAVSKSTHQTPIVEPEIDEEAEIIIEAEAEVVEEEKVAEPVKENRAQGLAEVKEEAPQPVAEKKSQSASPAGNNGDEHYERLLRVMAEFENYKKRMVKDKEDFQKFALEKLLTQFLPVMDNFERAISHCDNNEHTKSLLDGIWMIFKQLNDVLAKAGVRSFKSLGKQFDPAKHQAVQMKETADADPNTVIEEFQKGYFLHDRLIRAAMVVVAQQPSGVEEVELPSLDENPLEEDIEELEALDESAKDDIEELEELVEESEDIEELDELID